MVSLMLLLLVMMRNRFRHAKLSHNLDLDYKKIGDRAGDVGDAVRIVVDVTLAYSDNKLIQAHIVITLAMGRC